VRRRERADANHLAGVVEAHAKAAEAAAETDPAPPFAFLAHDGPPRIAQTTRVSWSFVVLPDTQIYARDRPHLFEAQTDFVLRERDRLGIQAVLHAGDVTDDNSDAQWEVAARALRKLDGQVPYVVALGNHDFGPGGSGGSRETGMTKWLPGRELNQCQRVETPDGPWVVLALEFAPRDETVAWARALLAEHRDAQAALVTHTYLYSDGTRYSQEGIRDQRWSPWFYGVAHDPAGMHDGESLWRELVEPCGNVRFVFCGHVLNEGVARRTDVRRDGSVCHQILANYQHTREGGASFLRVVTIEDGGVRAAVSTYAPYLDEHKTDPENAFELSLTSRR
jgi:3',5'-cyclic AMP phosphodiesterase CpdA